MSRQRYRRRNASLGSVVDDSAYIAAQFGPMGALITGTVGFVIFYSVLPMTLMLWVDSNKVKLAGPAASVFANILDQVIWMRFVNPCQWIGIAIFLVCGGIAMWKVFFSDELAKAELVEMSWLAKLLARLF